MSACISSGYGSPRVMAPGEAVPIFVSGKTVERWTLSDPTIASIEPDGHLHRLVGTRAGAVTVTASGEGFEVSETFHVADLSKVEGPRPTSSSPGSTTRLAGRCAVSETAAFA